MVVQCEEIGGAAGKLSEWVGGGYEGEIEKVEKCGPEEPPPLVWKTMVHPCGDHWLT